MKTWMKTTLAASLIAITGVGATAALARGGDCDGFGPHGGKAGWHRGAPEDMQKRMAERAELRLARLELALALTPQQQPAWSAFKSTLAGQAERTSAEWAKRAQQEAPKTAPERLQRAEELGKLRQAELAETRKAVESFYATLSDAQKKVFDADFGGRGPGGKGGHYGGPRGDGPRDGGKRGVERG
ncbi:Spy/CpxP family protein refolding chaperone [Pseudothauera rhizosphaerae]|uniref:LTXXQ motif family protein n=1 Tax=Pseudothauera rhizosphaerae TaxID=2565932 RepID=A0A4S4AND7_9RHOO|nr:Spy/CpxP family protein refolding chaperone [Pseudothauera rhizosphaerae]THF60617.1 hypothetical protein E6O51_12605 [Pseudothauera rhizosphaerae]